MSTDGNQPSPPSGDPGRHGGTHLRHVDPHAHHGPIHRAYARIAGGRLATWQARRRVWRAVWKLDPHLLQLTRGRVSTGLWVPTALLQTRGARTGLLRRNAVIYFHDGQRVTIIASQAGLPGNPSWYYNLRAHPADVVLAGQHFRAEVIDDDTERARLWELADRVFPGFPAYRERAARAGRTIPIVQLVPRRSAPPNFTK